MDERPTFQAAATGERRLAVALHGIEPATFERCALIRDWLDDHGVERVTLLVIPARDMHPVGERSPSMIAWLRERRFAGDSIAQHGFRHVCPPRAAQRRLSARTPARRGEFMGLDEHETRSAVHAGWRLLKLAGVEPDGFVAPAYAYTAALRRSLGVRFDWWAELLRVHRIDHAFERHAEHARGNGEHDAGEHRARAPLSPAWGPAAAGPLGRALAPVLVRAGSLLPTATLRLDVHPAYLQHPRHMLALEWVLERANARQNAVTYRELAGV